MFICGYGFTAEVIHSVLYSRPALRRPAVITVRENAANEIAQKALAGSASLRD